MMSTACRVREAVVCNARGLWEQPGLAEEKIVGQGPLLLCPLGLYIVSRREERAVTNNHLVFSLEMIGLL